MSPELQIRQLLARHREDPAPPLEISLPVHHQLDEDFCSTVTHAVGHHCTHWEKYRATPTLWRQIPDHCGIYMFVFESKLSFVRECEVYHPSWVLYVGRAGKVGSDRTLRDRYREEYSKYLSGNPEILWSNEYPRTRKEKLQRYLTLYPLQYWCSVINDRRQIEFIEDRLIKLLAPPLNTQQQPRLRRHAEQPAFRSPSDVK